MIISAKLIRKPRKKRFCEECERLIFGPQLRLYGMAEDGDPPWAMYIHPGCTESKDPKIRKVIEDYYGEWI